MFERATVPVLASQPPLTSTARSAVPITAGDGATVAERTRREQRALLELIRRGGDGAEDLAKTNAGEPGHLAGMTMEEA